jgi:hypothetical protein
MTEQLLAGGNVAGAVVRVGDTVRKPATAATPAVEALLEHLAGFDGAPRTLGRDAAGRHVLEYVAGETVHAGAPLRDDELRRLGALVRALHDACAAFVPPGDARWEVAIAPDRSELICHHDLAPWNLVRDGARWVFIDWDGAGPGSRRWDLAYVAQTFGGDPRRASLVLEGYGLEDRDGFGALVARRTWAMYERLRCGGETGVQPWARLWAEGHGDHWRAAAEDVERWAA